MTKHVAIANSLKTTTFQMRINPKIKARAEKLYAKCGMTLTDAVNVFIQQSLNVGGLPFIMNQDGKAVLREQAIAQLMLEIKKGEASVKSKKDWVSEEKIIAEFGGK
jgi:addiction module RelB/DinJ family antitoxin